MNSKSPLHVFTFLSTVLFVCNTGYAASGRILAEVFTPAIDPGLSNVQFWALDTGPVIGANGDVAFTAQLANDAGGSSIDTSNDNSLWIGTQDSVLGTELRLAIQENDPAPGTDAGVVFGNMNNSLTQLIAGDNGTIMIETVVKGTGVTGANDRGLWLVDPDDSVTFLTREGFQFSILWSWSFVESVANGPFVALYAREQASGNDGIWRWSPVSGFELVALRLNPAPSAFPDCTYASFGRPVINRQGQIAFDANLTQEVVGASCPSTVFRWSGAGEPQAVVSSGDIVPNFPVGTEFGAFGLAGNNVDPKINDAGDIAFLNNVLIPGTAQLFARSSLWVAKSNGDLALAMVQNQLLPGSSTELLTSPGINRFALGSRGIVTLQATTDTFGEDVILSGVPTTNYIFTALDDFGSNGLKVIARVGEPEPGTGILFGNLNQSLMNGSGKLAFTMYAGAGVASAHWTGSNPTNLELIARIGDPIDFGGTPRTVASFSGTSLVTAGETGGTGNSDGLPSQFSNTAQVVFRAVFTDTNANAIVLYPQDPEPDSDTDGILDSLDNCIEQSNANQRDTNGDGFGNACDADVNNNGLVDPADFSLVKSLVGQTSADEDLNGNGLVDPADFSFTKANVGQPPGPSCCAP